MPRPKKHQPTLPAIQLENDLFRLVEQVTSCPPERLPALQTALRNRLSDLRLALKLTTRRA